MEVRLHATFRDLAGGERRVEIDDGCACVADVIARLGERFPALGERLLDEQGAVRAFVAIMVGGRDIRHLEGLRTAVQADTELDLFPPVAGGAA